MTNKLEVRTPVTVYTTACLHATLSPLTINAASWSPGTGNATTCSPGTVHATSYCRLTVKATACYT